MPHRTQTSIEDQDLLYYKKYTTEETEKLFQNTLGTFQILGKQICERILQDTPELVLVLANSGWPMLWAAEFLWKEVTSLPFPTVVASNIGREKVDLYDDVRFSLCPYIEVYPFAASYAGAIEQGSFQVWLESQIEWQNSLKKQILDATENRIPKNLLILDEACFDGGTYRLTMGLLNILFPECKLCFMSGDCFEWKPIFSKKWILEQKIPASHKKIATIERLVQEILSGTEDDGDRDSFLWKPISEESKSVKDLQGILPDLNLLQISSWARHQIQAGIKNVNEQYSEIPPFFHSLFMKESLDADDLIMKEVWKKKRITSAEVCSMLKITPTRARKILQTLIKDEYLQRKGGGRNTVYVLPPVPDWKSEPNHELAETIVVKK